jgi:hypothetical protein
VLPFVVFCVVFGPLVFFGSLQALHAARVASIVALVVTLGMTLVWLPIAYFINQWIIDRATGARLLIRRYYASTMASLGVPIATCEMLLSHVSGSLGGIVRVYQRYSFEPEKKAAQEAYEKHLETILVQA